MVDDIISAEKRIDQLIAKLTLCLECIQRARLCETTLMVIGAGMLNPDIIQDTITQAQKMRTFYTFCKTRKFGDTAEKLLVMLEDPTRCVIKHRKKDV
jgi:hypothetical protein